MVGPRRVTKQHPRIGIGQLGQLEAKAKRAAAAGSLELVDATVVGMTTKHERAEQRGKAGIAAPAEIGLGLLPLPQQFLGRLDRPGDRGATRGVAVDADPDIDLFGPCVGIAHGDQRQQRIGGDRREGSKAGGLRTIERVEHGIHS